MKIAENTNKPAAFLVKELRQVRFTEIRKGDFAQLQFSLTNLFVPNRRRNCKFWVYVEHEDCYFDTEKELYHFMRGFNVAMGLNDPSFRDKLDDYRKHVKYDL
jgi:hypothetical protein